jgi:hypothetical protein
MLETSGLCPFHETCETHLALIRIQRKLYKERRESWSESSYLELVENSAVMGDYQRKIKSLNRIEERCSSNSRRCLRFWQKLRLENRDEMSGQPAHDGITQVTTG